ncbi:hypothetical protein NEMBOFW57_010977 [Staphylotrichum longicolle]|uniref:Protein kinase domain-containing protein n=1 Tax=Staphylotrichum longicolle TaxID=669026 RepID=A0AAD4HTA5_9PEZI|nr:hypothetical protein NEMBOFW57_010977 [Staphylotrichum longicolle]
MTSYVYPSAFSGDPASAATPPPAPSSLSTSSALNFATPPSSSQASHATTGKGLASFICHVAYLDDKLQRGGRSAFFTSQQTHIVNRQRIGDGASFIVERAELKESQGPDSNGKTRTVAIKTVRETRDIRNPWRDVLLEIRALLHEPIRYHPNIVNFLGIRWDASTDTGSPFPAIVQEYAAFGTLDKLQQRSEPLPFSIKQKLCYDVGRALSIIHACGMVHGDLKHENVLVFPNTQENPPNQPYTLKLADFGGTVMDMSDDGTHRIPMHTFPYEAPEISEKLTEEGAKKTDAYSYGMLIWRCMIDSRDVLGGLGLTRDAREKVTLLKLSDGLLEAAIHSISSYFFEHQLPGASLNLVTSALMFTLRGDPSQRALDRAQVRLRGMDSVAAYHYVGIKDDANKRTLEMQKHRTPGRHGMDTDSVGFALARLGKGDDYDAQNNLPGFRPDLPRPQRSGFLFEPLRLRHLLNRDQQETIVREFEVCADTPPAADDADGDLKPAPWLAAFFLFHSYLSGFGVAYDPTKACYWLRRAAEPSEEMGETDYLALAWLNRVHAALGVPNPYDLDKQMDNLFWSTIRGHRHCVEDSQTVIASGASAAQQQAWRQKMDQAVWLYRSMTASTGMPFFAPRKLSRDWDLDDLDALDGQIKQELGTAYAGCLRPLPDNEEASDSPPDDGYRFDKIYVNHKGHGLLHMAAVQGKLPALKHLYKKYLCDLSLGNQSHGDTPLTCACRTGRFDIAIWCLDNGADPNGSRFSEESPLHCIDAFNESEMGALVARLVAAGADLEKHSDASRKDVRGILADWGDTFFMTLTPLGRAVLKQSLPAVRTLLKHGASATSQRVDRNRPSKSPVELAAVLTLPDILEELLLHTDDAALLFDECEMLDAAHTNKVTAYDSLSLHSRLVRCGPHYRENLNRTLEILHKHKTKARVQHPPGKHLCNEILLGNTDIVSALLALGHDPSGSPGFHPLTAAVTANHAAIFHLLVSCQPSPSISVSPSLLHALATRPAHTPRDLSIAEYLLSHGVSADPIETSEPSPLVLSILHGFYDLADLLIAHGAGSSLNTLYTTIPGFKGNPGESSSLLGVLLPSQTSSSLRAIRYLAHLHKSGKQIISPVAFRVHSAEEDAGISVSALHALAEVPASAWNSHAQISAQILQLVLGMFPNTESLGEANSNTRTGTVVSAAVRAGQVEVLRAVLDTGDFTEDSHSTVRVGCSELEGEKGEPQLGNQKTLARLARTVALQKIVTLEERQEVTEGDVKGARRAVEVVEMLTELREEDAAGSPQEEMWNTADALRRVGLLESRVKLDFLEPEIDRVGEGVNWPVDLSVLTDEKPTAWTEGVEMTEEMSLRVFLKYFRQDNELFGDKIVKAMGKMFNKREDEDGVKG